MTFFKKTAASVLAIAMTASLLPTAAQAGGGRYYDGYYGRGVVVERHVVERRYHRPRHVHRHHHHRHHRGGSDAGAAIAGAVIGLAAGAIIGGALSQPDRHYVRPAPIYPAPKPVYRAPQPIYPAPAYGAYPPEPFSDAWYSYCAAKYRSFDPATGTFQPYHGPRRLCR